MHVHHAKYGIWGNVPRSLIFYIDLKINSEIVQLYSYKSVYLCNIFSLYMRVELDR